MIEAGRRSIEEVGALPGPGGGETDTRRRAIMMGVAAVLAGMSGIAMWKMFGRSGDPGNSSRRRVAIDSATGEVFTTFAIRDGDSQPWTHPGTGDRTMYSAESCFWTRDGSAKTTPTYVLLNGHAGKDGPTLCPDCGRTVVARNPMPPLDLIVAASKAAKTGAD